MRCSGFSGNTTPTDNPKPAKFSHGSHTLEVVWTILPAATLLFIAIYQMNAWAESKMRVPNEDDPNVVVMEVRARQFEWRVRYPGIHGGKLGQPGELFTVNDIHVPVNKMVLVHLKSEDVLHSFFLPNMRVKQDAVPGMNIPVWFRPIREGTYDLACSQLCGWGHYKMMGRLTVESEADYQAYLTRPGPASKTPRCPPRPPKLPRKSPNEHDVPPLRMASLRRASSFRTPPRMPTSRASWGRMSSRAITR